MLVDDGIVHEENDGPVSQPLVVADTPQSMVKEVLKHHRVDATFDDLGGYHCTL